MAVTCWLIQSPLLTAVILIYLEGIQCSWLLISA